MAESKINEWDDYKIATKRLNDSSDEILTEEEFLDELRNDLGWKVPEDKN